MKESNFGPGGKYEHETVEVLISLCRGTELIRIGSAHLVLSGEEEGEVKMNLPTKQLERKTASKQKLKAKPRKANKYGYFSNDFSRRYFLNENATLRVGVRVVSQKEQERKENELKEIFRRTDKLKEQVFEMRPGDKNTTNQPSKKEETATSKSLFSNFCSTSLCAQPASDYIPTEDIPMEIDTNQDLAHLGVMSIISSVSESTEGSDYSEDEIVEGNLYYI